MKNCRVLILIIFVLNLTFLFSQEKSKIDTVVKKQTIAPRKDSLRSVYMYIPEDDEKKVITLKPPTSNLPYILPIITLFLGVFVNKLWDYGTMGLIGRKPLELVKDGLES